MGIIENHRKLRHFLEEEGLVFASQTDSEVIAQLVAYHYRGDPLAALHAAIGDEGDLGRRPDP